ncbi:MAG: DUF7010 family protein [Bacillota bacterium]
MNLELLRQDIAKKQKKGLHFILASIIIWAALLYVHSTSLPILTKNFYTFCCTAPLVPLAFLISKLIKVEFSNKDNPLSNLGILFSTNQLLYLLIAMWVYSAVPEKMLMVITMIFGAHLLPYGWLYKSKSYIAFSVTVPILALVIGHRYETYVLALVMLAVEVIFSCILYIENKRMN